MSPETHQLAVEFLETKAGIEYSADVERTPEWRDAVDQAHEAPSAPPVTVSITLPMYTPQELVERITALAEGLTVVDGIKDAEVYLIRTCRGCECTDEEGCFGGCWWTSETDDLCSSCAPQNAATGAER